MPNNDNLLGIKIILETLSKDLEELSDGESLPNLKWDDMLTNSLLIFQKLSALRMEGISNEVKRLGYTIASQKREIAELRLNISNSVLPAAIAPEEKVVLSTEVEEKEELDFLLDNKPTSSQLSSQPQEQSLSQPQIQSQPPSQSQTQPKPHTQPQLQSLFQPQAVESSLNHTPPWLTDTPGSPVSELFAAINLNDKLCFIRELFADDVDQYRLTVQRLNDMNSFEEALDYTRNAFPDWDESSDALYRFYMALRRRYHNG